MKYVPQVQRFYKALHEAGHAANVVAFDADLSGYKLVVAPVLYMVKPGMAERLRAFVENGGTLVVSYFSGIADETDLVFTDGYPGPLRDIAGVWVEEIDALPPTESNQIQFAGGIEAGLLAECRLFFERVHP